MRPLTPRRVAWICAGLGLVLFAVAVISLRMGAYPISAARVSTADRVLGAITASE